MTSAWPATRNAWSWSRRRWRCLSFVGGQGIVRWQARVRAEAMARLTPGERRARAREKLLAAHVQVSSGLAQLDAALSSSRADIAGLSFDRGHEKQSLWAEAIGTLQGAQALAQEAAQLLGDTLVGQDLSETLSPMLLSLDIGWFTDGLPTDLTVHEH